MRYTAASEEELEHVAKDVLASLSPYPDRARVIGLSGELGSGKTAFTKAIAKELGITEEVLSPTFVIAKFYELDRKSFRRLIHIDAYRIEDPRELNALRWDELIADPGNLIVFEWPEMAKERFPQEANILRFFVVDERTRAIESSL